MGSEIEHLSSTPKLSLFSLPRPEESPGMVTPPPKTQISIPFQWEEAPGKPRPYATIAAETSKPKAARCLDLPPRLVNEAKFSNTPSPTTVLDGPYSDRFLSHALSFSFRKASFRRPEGGVVLEQISKEKWNFSSWRWGTFKENSCDEGGSCDFSPSIGVPSEIDVSEVKIARGRKKSGFFHSSKWASIYESFKQVVPWRRKQGKSRSTLS